MTGYEVWHQWTEEIQERYSDLPLNSLIAIFFLSHGPLRKSVWSCFIFEYYFKPPVISCFCWCYALMFRKERECRMSGSCFHELNREINKWWDDRQKINCLWKRGESSWWSFHLMSVSRGGGHHLEPWGVCLDPPHAAIKTRSFFFFSSWILNMRTTLLLILLMSMFALRESSFLSLILLFKWTWCLVDVF